MSALGWMLMIVAVAAVVGVILFCAGAASPDENETDDYYTGGKE